jgi:O-acetyl-ADP-ribose deacetylase (regulator of RNase III)/uncharacterized protein YwgA
MVDILVGDLFESEAQTLVNTVNCVGVMGKGVALEFKKRFPDMYADYLRRCERGEVRLGRPYLFRRPTPPWILNFPTKNHWRATSELSSIEAGLEYLGQHYREWGIESLAVPPLGCGQGGLDWEVVGPVLVRHLQRLDIPVKLYAPREASQTGLGLMVGSRDTPRSAVASADGAGHRLNPAWVALAEIVARIEREPYHWPVGRIMFQKIAYFATQCGLPTGLSYARSSYGPFAPDLKRVTSRLLHNGLIREEQQGRMFAVKPGPAYRDAVRAYENDLARWEPEIERIVDLFLRMNTDQAEVAATAHFAAMELEEATHGRPSERAVLAAVQQWKARRDTPLTDEGIASAIRNLNLLGWLHLEPSSGLPLPDDEPVEV